MDVDDTVCPECNTSFGRKNERDRHLREAHHDSKHCPFPHCTYYNKRKSKFTAHLKTAHNLVAEVAEQVYMSAVATVVGNAPILGNTASPPTFTNVHPPMLLSQRDDFITYEQMANPASFSSMSLEDMSSVVSREPLDPALAAQDYPESFGTQSNQNPPNQAPKTSQSVPKTSQTAPTNHHSNGAALPPRETPKENSTSS